MRTPHLSQVIGALLATLIFAGCSDLLTEQKPYQIKTGVGGTGGYGGSSGGGSSGGGSGGSSGGASYPPNEEAFVASISSQHPGMINDCTGHPIANNFLLTVVRALQQRDSHWGFMIKDGGARIPRDILAYAPSGAEGTHNFFVIDFVASGCNNTPSDPSFADPQPSASVWWNVTNPNGYADNGVWSANP